MADTEVGIAHGTRIAARTSPLPLNTRFITNAAANPIINSKTTVAIVNSNVNKISSPARLSVKILA